MTGHSLNAEFLSPDELAAKGVPDAAERNILIHRTCVVLDFAHIHFGRNIRIDPYCIISCAELHLGDYIHIGAGTSLSGACSVVLADYSTVSHHCLIFTSSDDYSGFAMTNPMVPARYTNVTSADVSLGRHALLGARCTVLPGAVIEEGASAGVGCLIKDRLEAWTMYVGVPARPLRPRSRRCLELEAALRAEADNPGPKQ
jgi:dTDP-4-amino-4,6-dideoxy-D-glucose acyltransferase